MELNTLLRQDYCRVFQSNTKTEALLELIDLLEQNGAEGTVKDLEGLKKEIFYREQIMSTGIGQGIGIPHVRFSGVSEPQVLVGVKPEGFDDYESLDGEPVKMVFMILVGENHHKEYLRILSLLVHRLKEDEFRSSLASAENSEAVYSILTGDAL